MAIDDFGKRDKHHDRARGIVLALLLLVILGLNLVPGGRLERQRLAGVESTAANWAVADHAQGVGDRYLEAKADGVTRIVYISNSHAKAGGDLATHLQGLLDNAVPGRFEVLDLAQPGIFAPDVLQRGLRALDYQPDLLVLGMNYINFSDRMRLSLQAHSTRSFFNRGIFTRLPAGFWGRNYDINLYLDTLVARLSPLYRNRNALRNTWEQPAVASLQSATGDPRPVFFLDMEESERWRFPDGYDNNLFQWHLYAAGRRGHMADLRALVDAYGERDIPVLGLNMPIDLDKSVYAYDETDFTRFNAELAAVFAGTLGYVNYETFFPKRFSTYDALHPTWHGARLHAFDLMLRLKAHGFMPDNLAAGDLLATFRDSDQGVSEDYRQALAGNFPDPENPNAFIRYDVSEPGNAREIMRQLATADLGSARHTRIQNRLMLIMRFWEQASFAENAGDNDIYPAIWQRATAHEIAAGRERMAWFHRVFVASEEIRLRQYPLPLPQMPDLAPERTQSFSVGSVTISYSSYRTDTGIQIEIARLPDGRPVVQGVRFPDGTGYYRIDMLGDGSFIRMQPAGEIVEFPNWIQGDPPMSRWGV